MAHVSHRLMSPLNRDPADGFRSLKNGRRTNVAHAESLGYIRVRIRDQHGNPGWTPSQHALHQAVQFRGGYDTSQEFGDLLGGAGQYPAAVGPECVRTSCSGKACDTLANPEAESHLGAGELRRGSET